MNLLRDGTRPEYLLRQFFLLATLTCGTCCVLSMPGCGRPADDVFQQGLACSKDGRHATAIEYFTEAIRLKPNFAEAYYQRGVARYHQARQQQASGCLSHSAHYDDVAQELRDLFPGRNVEISVRQRSLHLSPTMADDKTIAQLRADDVVDVDKRTPYRQACEVLAELSKHLAENPEDAAAYNNRGCVFQRRGDLDNNTDDYDHALVDFDEVLRLRPDDAVAHFNRGTVYAFRADTNDSPDDFRRAFADLDEAIRLDSEMAAAYATRGQLHESQGQLKDAVADFTVAATLDPNFCTVTSQEKTPLHDSLFAEAIDDFSEAIRLAPAFGAAYANRGLAYWDQGDHIKAREDFVMAGQLDEKPR